MTKLKRKDANDIGRCFYQKKSKKNIFKVLRISQNMCIKKALHIYYIILILTLNFKQQPFYRK